MTTRRYWPIGLTLLVPRIRGGRWLCGGLIFAALFALFMATGVFGAGPADHLSANSAAALFFCVIIAYIVPVFHYISERTVQAIDGLAPDLDPEAGPVGVIRARVHQKPRAWFAVVLGLGFAAGAAHNVVLAAGENIHAASRVAFVGMVLGTVLTWMVLTLVIAALIDNAILLNRLAHSVRLNPLSPERLRPFALVAVLSTLAIIGAQAAFPIMIFDAEVNSIAFVPGLIATMVPMVVLAVLPIWPLHRRIRIAKLAMLRDINERIAQIPPRPAERQNVAELAPLLAYRREVADLPEWPFDVMIMGRLAFYLIIPPLTWVCAAVIQNAVDTML